MKKLKIATCITTGILLITLIIISLYTVSLRKELTDCNKIDNSCESKAPNEDITNETNEEKKEETLTYDCSFTRTYNIVNTLDGYKSEVLELSYIVIDAFQDHYARTHVIPTKLKEELETGTTYEFTYKITGTGIINDMEDIYDRIVSTTIYEEDKEHYLNEPKLKVTLSINKTDKLGLGQLQEPICKGK